MAPTTSSRSNQTQFTHSKTLQSKRRLNYKTLIKSEPQSQKYPHRQGIEWNRLAEYATTRTARTNPCRHCGADQSSQTLRERTEIGYRNFNLDGISLPEEEDLDGFYKKFVKSTINGVKLGPKCTVMIHGSTGSDAPVGTGFSYAKSPRAYHMDDTLNAAQDYTFLMKWLMDHPNFVDNPLYVSGDSYAGVIVPIVAQHIYDGNEAGHEPPINIQGYVLGNPATDVLKDKNERLPYAHRLALISDYLYESTKENCNGRYVDADPNNAACMSDLQLVYECISRLDPAQILEPNCDALSPRPNLLRWDPNTFPEDPDPLLLHSIPEPWCRSYHYLYSYIWANDRSVQEALHVRPGTKEEWIRCNKTLSETAYNYNVQSSFNYHRNLTNKRCRALIYSGDHDMVIPYMGTLKWINALNLTISDGWQPWLVDGQVGGYTEKYTKSSYLLTFATVKGGGHTAPEYKPKECLAMINRWLAHFDL